MILAKWDPIGVSNDMAIDEYEEYPMILHSLSNQQELMKYLELFLQIRYVLIMILMIKSNLMIYGKFVIVLSKLGKENQIKNI